MEQLTDTTRERIAEAAGEIFAERGYDVATVRDICQAAGANLAAVNYYFGGKRQLYVEAVVRAHRWRIEQAVLPDWPADTPAETRLADFIGTFIRRIRIEPDETWHTRLFMREMTQPTDACAEIVHASIGPQFEILKSILRELLPADTTEELLHLTAFSIVGQCLFYRFADPVIRNLLDAEEYAGHDADKLAAHISRFTLAALSSAIDAQTTSDGKRR